MCAIAISFSPMLVEGSRLQYHKFITGSVIVLFCSYSYDSHFFIYFQSMEKTPSGKFDQTQERHYTWMVFLVMAWLWELQCWPVCWPTTFDMISLLYMHNVYQWTMLNFFFGPNFLKLIQL